MPAQFHLTEYPSDYEPSDRLGALLLNALEIGAVCIRAGRDLVPMLIVDTGGKSDLIVFNELSEDDAARRASADLKSRGTAYDAYVLLYPVTLTGDDFEGRINALAAEGADRDADQGYRLFGIVESQKVNPLYHGRCRQLAQ